ncbi:MAG: sulfotransferase family protein [Planctomycetaceae bacterium]
MSSPASDDRHPQHLLFIVGVPRSGTTMVRELVSHHPQIEITLDEMQLLPKLMLLHGRHPDFSSHDVLESIESVVSRSNFIYHMRKHGFNFDAPRFRSQVLKSPRADWHVVIDALVRQFLPPPSDSDPTVIVGEKTPSNLMHLEMLADYLPHSRFIHVVRDPRDTCLSMRQVWGKSFYRGAVRWRRYLDHYHRITRSGSIAARCVQIRYEDLLEDPAPSMARICDFLKLPFAPQMLSLRRSAEKLGAAAGANTIRRSNSAKFEAAMSPATIKMIESITWTPMQQCGYQPLHATSERPISRLKYAWMGAGDLLHGMRHQMRDKGMIAGLRYRMWQLYSH